MSALTDVFANMDISIPADKMQQLAQKVMTGYKDTSSATAFWGWTRSVLTSILPVTSSSS